MRLIHSALLAMLASVSLVFFGPLASAQEVVKLEIRNLGKAPAFSYNDETGNRQALDTSKHKLTALHFWATWCVPCVDELPQVDDAQDIFGADLQIVAVSLDGKRVDKVKKFYADHKIRHLSVLVDPTNKTSKTAGLKGLPGTIFINSKGNIVARADGPLDWQQEDVVNFIKKRLK